MATESRRTPSGPVQLPDMETLRARLDYDPATGVLTWRPRPIATYQDRRWNTRYAGREAGSKSVRCHVNVGIGGVLYLAHRIAWKVTYGEEPPALIDHVNGDPGDNRIVNLRAATTAENQANQKVQRRTSSGAKGVSFHKRLGKFQAKVTANGRGHYIGYFDTIAEAKAARDAKARELHGEFFNPG